MEPTKSQRQTLKKILDKLVLELETDLVQAKKSSQPVKLDQQAVGRVSRIDAIQQQQMHKAALERLETRIAMVRAAIAKIDHEDFGFCVTCEEPIGFERLKARPESPLCLDCARRTG